ncbi:MAG: hypothetical protein J2P54_16210 [Bradyrhizobiaceae bacterium]|nr:hypothetical protein [Bradyrhizobiaceae bacterium]
MAIIRMLIAPIRGVLRFPVFQMVVVVLIILFLEAGSDEPGLAQIFDGLDKLVIASVDLFGSVFDVKSFTRSFLTTGFWIGYVYVACLMIFFWLRWALGLLLDRIARTNAWLRNALARERGIAAYRAWQPLEAIRPPNISQEKWEEIYAWPPNNKPPYPPLVYRLLRDAVSYVIVILIAAALLQWFTPLPALSWLGRLARVLTVG